MSFICNLVFGDVALYSNTHGKDVFSNLKNSWTILKDVYSFEDEFA